MRRSGAFFIAVLLVLWITPALYAGDSSGATTAAQPADSSITNPQPADTPSIVAAPPADSSSNPPDAPSAPAPKKKELQPVFSINQIEVFYTTGAKPDAVFGYGTTDHDLLTFQFEHFSFHSWGELYVDAEVYQGRNVGTPFSNGNNWVSLLVLNPYLSLSKVTKKKIAWGPVSDVTLVARFERESYFDFWTRNFGPSINFKVPGFVWFESGFLARYDNINKKNTYLWRSVLLSNSLKLGSQRVHYNLLSLINGTATNHTSIFERSDFLWEVPHYSRIQLGMRVEVENYSNDPIAGSEGFPNERYKRVMPEAMAKYIF
jgi:hypothetical protein